MPKREANVGQRGFFGIGIENGKTPENLGTLWRSAAQLGAAFIFTIGRRYRKQYSDTRKAWRHTPLWHFESLDDFRSPYNCPIIGIELANNAKPIGNFIHPERAIYLLGAEDHGLSKAALAQCHDVIFLPGGSYNVAVAGSLVMFDRYNQNDYGNVQKELLPQLQTI